MNFLLSKIYHFIFCYIIIITLIYCAKNNTVMMLYSTRPIPHHHSNFSS